MQYSQKNFMRIIGNDLKISGKNNRYNFEHNRYRPIVVVLISVQIISICIWKNYFISRHGNLFKPSNLTKNLGLGQMFEHLITSKLIELSNPLRNIRIFDV